MDFSIAVATNADAWKVVERADELGFHSAWFYDTQMLSADCFVAMGAAAVKSNRIRLGTGVLVPTNRIAPVTANAFASLNALAPGRIDFGVGTGFTARRAMGLDAMKLADMESYIHVVYELLAERTVEETFEGKTRKIRFLNPEKGLINTRDPIPLHVSAYGPRARKLTAKLKAGWLYFASNVAVGVENLEAMRTSWEEAGHARDDLEATVFALGCVLEEGEAYDSDRAIAQAGPRAALVLHRAADEAMLGLYNASGVPPAAAEAVAGYVELAKSFDKETFYLQNHRGHLIFVKPEERKFITAELIRDTSFTATEAELVQRIGDLRDAGYRQFTVQLTPGNEHAIEDWARIKKHFD